MGCVADDTFDGVGNIFGCPYVFFRYFGLLGIFFLFFIFIRFAKFEQFPMLISLGVPSQVRYGFIRQGLVMGLKLESKLGHYALRHFARPDRLEPRPSRAGDRNQRQE